MYYTNNALNLKEVVQSSVDFESVETLQFYYGIFDKVVWKTSFASIKR